MDNRAYEKEMRYCEQVYQEQQQHMEQERKLRTRMKQEEERCQIQKIKDNLGHQGWDKALNMQHNYDERERCFKNIHVKEGPVTIKSPPELVKEELNVRRRLFHKPEPTQRTIGRYQEQFLTQPAYRTVSNFG